MTGGVKITPRFLDGHHFRPRFSGVTRASTAVMLDSSPEEAFDRLTRLAARLLGTPAAMITLARADRTDESLGLVGAGESGAAAPARAGDASRDDRSDRSSARRSAR